MRIDLPSVCASEVTANELFSQIPAGERIEIHARRVAVATMLFVRTVAAHLNDARPSKVIIHGAPEELYEPLGELVSGLVVMRF